MTERDSQRDTEGFSWNKVQRNLSRGAEKLSWMARFLAERTRKETILVKTAYAARKTEEQIDEAYRDAGRRLWAVRHAEEPLSDYELQEILAAIGRLNARLDEQAAQARAMGGSFDEGTVDEEGRPPGARSDREEE